VNVSDSGLWTRDPEKSRFLYPPHFLQIPTPPRAVAVGFVAHRVLPVVVMVVLFSRIETSGRDDLGADRRGEFPRGLQLRLRLAGEALLPGVVEKNGRAVLAAAVGKLPAAVGRVDVPPEDFEQFP
jgi:hypothetical protein